MKSALFIHQLPQNIIGYFLSKTSYVFLDYEMNDGEVIRIYFSDKVFGAGISLGNYIVLDIKYMNYNIFKTANHEHGHQIQSRKLGWLYLPTVGLISLLRNIYDRLFHKKWDYEKREQWYYKGWPESSADDYGLVDR